MNTHKVQSAKYQIDGHNEHDQNMMIETDTRRHGEGEEKSEWSEMKEHKRTHKRDTLRDKDEIQMTTKKTPKNLNIKTIIVQASD